MSDVDHAVRAREILDAAVDSANAIATMLNEPLGGLPRDRLAEIEARGRDAEHRLTSVDRMHAAAHVHATLALAEQQRIANVLAMARLRGGYPEFLGLHERVDSAVLHPDMLEALGI
jgi:hypothetical protein